MGKKSIALLMAVIMLVSVFAPQLNVNAADSSMVDSGTATVTTTGAGIGVTIGTAIGTVGDTVTVPITFKNVVNSGDVAVCSLYIGYDTSFLEATAVTAGALVLNPQVNFKSNINTNGGSIAFLFLDNTMGSEMITTDGVFAYITFKLKSTPADIITPVLFNKEGVFGDKNGIRIASGDMNNGSITIKVGNTLK